jgi:hypothetical protein
MRQLAKFSISVRDDDFLLRLVDGSGQAHDFAASPEQLDAVIDAIDDLLSETDEEDFFGGQDDPRIYHKPLG